VDVGCGWGSLLLHAAKHYGVEAVGVTLAREQARWVERAVGEAGLTDRVKVVISDYRDFNDPAGFDKAASISMAEHVGVKNLPVYMGSVFRNLRPGGVYMHHTITLRPNTPYPVWTPFSLKYVFPNGELQTIVQVLAAAAEAGFEVRDVENLREHYTITLGHWVKRLEANRDKAIALIGEVSYRIFRLYIAAATMSFKDGVTALDQCLLLKPLAGGRSGLPLTRNDWYD